MILQGGDFAVSVERSAPKSLASVREERSHRTHDDKERGGNKIPFGWSGGETSQQIFGPALETPEDHLGVLRKQNKEEITLQDTMAMRLIKGSMLGFRAPLNLDLGSQEEMGCVASHGSR